MKRDSLALRIFISIGLILLLMIPLFMIQLLIEERQSYREKAVSEISSTWASSQTVAGPILTLENEVWNTDKEGNKYSTSKDYHLLPENLKYETVLYPEVRYRGIYEVTLYKSKIKISGFFDFNKVKKINVKEFLANTKEKYLNFNVTDLKGIQDNIALNWNNATLEVNPGTKNDIFKSGFSSNVDISDSIMVYNFEILLDLKGSENLMFIPIGKTTETHMKSRWNNPSFSGDFLPQKRTINSKNFSAMWNINYFNRNYPQEWYNCTYDLSHTKYGVNLIVPVDEYQKTMRTSKYGILILLLTFLTFFMIEIFAAKSLHPVQYLLVGFALVLFYSLLLSLSEYIIFSNSYLISGALIVGLIGFYTLAIYKNLKLGLIIGLILAGFYGFMYVLLQLQDLSLLLGTVALFIILTVIMILTRKINWYEVLSAKKSIKPQAPEGQGNV